VNQKRESLVFLGWYGFFPEMIKEGEDTVSWLAMETRIKKKHAGNNKGTGQLCMG